MKLVDKYGKLIDDPFTHHWETEKGLEPQPKNWFWHIEAAEDGFYSIQTGAIPAFGESGEFTLDEVHLFVKEFDKVHNPSIRRSHETARNLRIEIIKKCLTPERFEEFINNNK